jgi:hypothetical protein
LILKPKKLPLRILKLEALRRRLPVNHTSRKRIEEEYKIAMAGYKGEKSIEYYLADFSDEKHHIFHDLRFLHKGEDFFQLDIVMLTSHYLLILEIKNITGTLYFDRHAQQLLRYTNGEQEGFPDPITQVDRQERLLKEWLVTNKLPSIPIHSHIVISHPTTIIKTTPGYEEIFQKVIHAASIPKKIQKLDQMNNRNQITQKELDQISHKLLERNIPSVPDILQKFQIDKSDILTGVHCPMCSVLPIDKKRGCWYCHQCDINHKKAHLSSLNDYFLLLNPTITNKQAREYLHIPSTWIASKLLISLNLKQKGMKKNRSYELSLFE